MSPAALAHLSKADPVMRRLIRAAGPCTLTPNGLRTPFEALVRAVAHQQLNGTAAETILRRFIALFPRKRFPAPGDLAAVDDPTIRACGFSHAKVAALRDIAAQTLAGVVPSARRIGVMPDEEIIERLVQVRGVGRWTVEMLLLFKLGRPDVLPVDDFGVRTGFRIAYARAEMPKPKELLEFGERWRPWRSVATWYLYRAVDLERERASRKGVKA